MHDLSRRGWLNLCALSPLALAQQAPGARRWSEESPRESMRKRHFPDLRLTTHAGRSVRFYTDLLRGRVVLLHFMYASCEGICVPTTANLVKVQALLGPRAGRDVFLYSLTLKPELDTPAVLANYAEAHGAGPGWSFLTGAPADLETLRRSLGFVDPDPELDADRANHTGMVRLGNEPQVLWAACPGLSAPETIVAALGWIDGSSRTGASAPR